MILKIEDRLTCYWCSGPQGSTWCGMMEWRSAALRGFAPLLSENKKYNIEEISSCVTSLLLLCESFMAPNCAGRVLIKMIKMDREKRLSEMFIAVCNPSLKRENKLNGN